MNSTKDENQSIISKDEKLAIEYRKKKIKPLKLKSWQIEPLTLKFDKLNAFNLKRWELYGDSL